MISDEVFGLIIGTLIGFFVGLFFMCVAMGDYMEERDILKQEAIKHGAAEYVIVDPSTGKTEFKWKETK